MVAIRMRYSHGIKDQEKILLYRPQLFLKMNDVLVFPSKDFQKWHGDIKEFIDGLYQINSVEMEKGKSINIAELDLAIAVLNNIKNEFGTLFDSKKVSDLSFQYISILDEKYKRQKKNNYSSDMRRCDIQIPVKPEITPQLKYKHLMELIKYANQEFDQALKENAPAD